MALFVFLQSETVVQTERRHFKAATLAAILNEEKALGTRLGGGEEKVLGTKLFQTG